MIGWISAVGLAPLLAEAESYRHMGRRFQANAPSVQTADVVLAVAIIVVPLLALVLFRVGQRMRRNFQERRGEALFLELCRAHELDWRSRLQLWRLVRQLRLEPPAAIFLSSDKLALAMRDKKRSTSEREEIGRLAQAIFGTSASAPVPEIR
jgi:hypothetical protein